MPTCGGPVYQPTTVSYEPRSTENGDGNVGALSFLGPASSIDMTSPLRVFRKPGAQLSLLLLALLTMAAGLAMLASGTVDLVESQEYMQNQLTVDLSSSTLSDNNTSVHVEEMPTKNDDTDLPMGILLCGVLLICLGFIGLGFYIKVAEWRHNCVCPCSCRLFDKKQTLARQLQCQNNSAACGQGIMALNPSTDPLVSHTQYAPVSELPSSLRGDDEERRNLMPDNKDCLSSAEESDRMLEPDPRIVLRPMGRVEDA